MNERRSLNWGILGTAKIARQWLVPAMQAATNARVVAVASRQQEKAQAFAHDFGIEQVYSDYEALIRDPAVDAVYIPLPNHLHVHWSRMAIAEGKHVLCEKPLGMNVQEVRSLMAAAEAAPKLLVMEAFMYRFHPQWKKVVQLLNQGAIGRVNRVEASFTYFNRNANDVRNQADIGGGGVLDIGCYCVSVARLIFNSLPRAVVSQMDIDPEFGVDRHASGLMDFGQGTATFFCSTQSQPSQNVTIWGDQGRLQILSPFYDPGRPARIVLVRESHEEVLELESCNHYVEQIQDFSLAALEGLEAPAPLTDALANAQVLDALFESARRKSWVELKD